MSVTTTADEKLALAKQKIKEARDLLIESVHEDTWGSDNWRNDYKGNIWDCVRELAAVQFKLK